MPAIFFCMAGKDRTGFVAAVLKGHGFGWPKSDPLQLPGAFLLRDGVIVRAFRHATSADRPDYCELAA